MGAIGLMGSMASLLALLALAPPPLELEQYALVRAVMAAIAGWVFFPSLGVMLVAGLLSLAWVRAYHNAGWAWAKAVSGIVVFQSGLIGVMGPIQQEADRSAQALAGKFDPSALAASLTSERNTLWLLLAVSVANVVLGVWRPRLSWRPR
jgi:hypothetical protein